MVKFLLSYIFFFLALSIPASYADAKPPMIVVHGGPGLNHEYLVPGLSFIQQKRDLIFYDQKDCKKYDCSDETLSMNDLLNQLEEKTQKYKEYGLIAHSWGGFLVMSYLKKAKNLPSEVIFITPMPLKKQRMDHDISLLLQKVPQQDRHYFEPAKNQETCLKNLPKLFKYYYFDQKEHPYLGRHCNMNLESQLSAEIEKYDGTAFLSKLPKKTLWVRGESDILKADPEVKWIEIKKAGHFPFDENPMEFQKTINLFLNSK